MNKNRTVMALLAAGLIALAGCTGGVPGGGLDTADDATGSVDFYISDQQNDIDDFEHLNATVTSVSFYRVNESADATDVTDADDEDGEADADGNGEWVTYDIEDRTVDLTELQGERATMIASMDVPNGTYTQVRIEVSDVDGTLVSDEETNVKLPSERLKLNDEFTVGDGEELDFVFDITVRRAGNSGKYVLKPVVSESGTDVPIEAVGNAGDDADDEEMDDEETTSTAESVAAPAVATTGWTTG